MRYAIALFLPCLFLCGPASAERMGSGLTKWNNDASLGLHRIWRGPNFRRSRSYRRPSRQYQRERDQPNDQPLRE